MVDMNNEVIKFTVYHSIEMQTFLSITINDKVDTGMKKATKPW